MQPGAMQIRNIQPGIKAPPLSRSIQDVIGLQVDSTSASDARNSFGLYTRVIVETIFRRSLSDSHNTIPYKCFPYFNLRSILIFKLVSKELFRLSNIIGNVAVNEKTIPLLKSTKERISSLPLVAYSGPLKVISQPCQIEKAVRKLTTEILLGFDTESKPAFKKGETYLPSLIQIAGEKKVYIFQLHLTTIEPFKALFENKSIKKVGVGIRDDVMQLRKLGVFEAAGFVEISNLPRCNKIYNKGLQALVAYSLEVQILKPKKLQLSNWSNQNLTQAQIIYAATDTWISRELYKKLLDE